MIASQVASSIVAAAEGLTPPIEVVEAQAKAREEEQAGRLRSEPRI